jgi:TP901 family phage tail tape measure protein
MSVLTSQLIISLIDRVTEPARRAAGSLAGITHRIREANGQRLGLSDRLDLALSRNADALDRARLGVIDVAGSYATLHAAIAGPIQTAAEFEAAMASVAKVVDFPTPEAFEAFQNELFRLSREIPFAVNGLAEIAAAAGQAGIAGADLTRFTAAAAKIGVAFDISSEQSGTAMANMMTALGLSVDEAILLADAMNHLSNSQASSAADILSVVQSVGAQATMFGFTAEQTAAFASAMLAAGAQSDVAATSFRNMGAALTRGASATGSQRDALQALGLDAEQVARSMQENAVETTTDVLRRIAQLPAEHQAAISTDLFGSEARALGPLLTNLELIEGTLAMVGDQSRYAGSAFAEFAAQNDTFNSHLQRFLSLLDEFKIRIGNALIPALVRLGQAIAPIIVAASEFAATYPEVTTAIVGSIAGFIALKGALAGLTFVGLLGRGGALNLLAAGFRSLFLVARAEPPSCGWRGAVLPEQQLGGRQSGHRCVQGVFLGGHERGQPCTREVHRPRGGRSVVVQPADGANRSRSVAALGVGGGHCGGRCGGGSCESGIRPARLPVQSGRRSTGGAGAGAQRGQANRWQFGGWALGGLVACHVLECGSGSGLPGLGG